VSFASHRRWYALGLIAPVVGIAGWIGYRGFGTSEPGEDVLARVAIGGPSAGLESGALSSFERWTGPPLFQFGSLYLEGRSSWCRERFEEDRDRLVAETVPDEVLVDTRVLRDTFSAGPWVEHLSRAEATARRETESQAVVVEALFPIAGAEPVDLLVFLLCSDFRVRLPVDAASGCERLLPGDELPDDCLGSAPRLGSNEMMTRELWGASLQRRASDVWFLNRVGRDGETYFYVYEAWRNCPHDGDYVNVKMSTGQYTIVDRGDTCLVRVRTYYSGQEVPNFFGVGTLVASRTRSFYRGLAKTVQELAPRWEPDEPARAWRDGLRFDAEARRSESDGG